MQKVIEIMHKKSFEQHTCYTNAKYFFWTGQKSLMEGSLKYLTHAYIDYIV